MGILDIASGASVWRGYSYYKNGKVLAKQQLSETKFTGTLSGSNHAQYEVFIDIEHPRKSHCSCPHADGKRIVCKHQVALFFSFFPEEAEKYYRDVLEYEAYEAEEERRQEELDEKIIACIHRLSKRELEDILYDVLYSSEDWVFDKFVREYID